jgi:hypothetical protein
MSRQRQISHRVVVHGVRERSFRPLLAPPSPDLFAGDVLLALTRMLGDGVGDGVVEAEVQDVEVGDAELLRLSARQLGDCLADVVMVVDDLGDGEAAPEQSLPCLVSPIATEFDGPALATLRSILTVRVRWFDSSAALARSRCSRCCPMAACRS